MSLFDSLSGAWNSLLGTNKHRAITKIEAMNPFVQSDPMIESIVDQKLADAEWKITYAIEKKLRDKGISDMQTRVASKMQDQVDAAVSDLMDGTPGLDLDQYNVGLNPKVLARIQERLAYFELSLTSRIASRFVPKKGLHTAIDWANSAVT